MFIITLVTLELKSPATGIVLRIVYTLMFAAIAERPGFGKAHIEKQADAR